MADNPYADIINLPHHVSKDRSHLTMHQRAAQFSPFAALVGYSDVIDEIESVTTPERELSEDEKAELDRRIAIIAAHLSDNPVVTVEYFVPDSRKEGGEYRVKTGKVERISQAKRVVVVSGESIRVNRIVRLEGELFVGEF